MNPFKCPNCGYRNYLTRKDLDRESREADKAMESLEWEFRHPRHATIRRVLRNIGSAVFWWPWRRLDRPTPVKEHGDE